MKNQMRLHQRQRKKRARLMLSVPNLTELQAPSTIELMPLKAGLATMSEPTQETPLEILTQETVTGETPTEPVKRKYRQRKPRLQPTDHPNATTGTPENSGDTPPADMVPDKKRSKAALQLIKDLTQFYQSIGGVLYVIDQFDGMIILQSAEQRAIELVDVATHNRAMFVFLQRMVKGSDWTALVIGHGTVALAILQHHNVLPPLDQIPELIRKSFTRKSASKPLPPSPPAMPTFTPDIPSDEMMNGFNADDIRAEIRRA